ncbi:unnamed protein product [Acanthocheilonema viteae]|uniref:Uncharacterized protein n=1 Tax=Acanthocheilonema viteae TaxID=6277 RepID=A0A498S1B6_ACAVI|nr:unnamed protein product [Acanthocheilonema viteae]
MGRSIKGLRRVQSEQSEGEVLDWTVRSDRTGGGIDKGGTEGLAACLPRKQQEAAAAKVLVAVRTGNSEQYATTVSAAKKRCMQQQHSAAASNSGFSAVVPAVEPTTVTVVDRLKHQLLQAYDNALKGMGQINMWGSTRKQRDSLSYHLRLPTEGNIFSNINKHNKKQREKRMKDDAQLLAGRHRTGHGCDHQIGEVQFDEGITRGEDISNFHPKLKSEENELGYILESGQMERGPPCTPRSVRRLPAPLRQ